ncbi:MAG TPA: repressor LexA [Planctomycetaceae bacterium]|nr:repressor LexA [Planctomycetaceae bacterium]HRF01534.1 transcriptional repressor LexA [Pirellulaceae bacterium]
MLDRLTERQREVYHFIRELIQGRGYGPTIREIGDRFGFVSPNGVMCHLRALERKGLISRSPKKSRAIELKGEPPTPPAGIPLAGRVAAGSLHEAVEQEQRIDFGEMLHRPGTFALEVMGESMIEAQIADGDYVVVDPSKPPRKGDIVVARTDEGEATVKYWFPETGRIRLQPANASMQPIYVRDVVPLGVVVGVVRKLD